MSKTTQQIPVNICPDCGTDLGLLAYHQHQGAVGCVQRQLRRAEAVIKDGWLLVTCRGSTTQLRRRTSVSDQSKETIRKVLKKKRQSKRVY